MEVVPKDLEGRKPGASILMSPTCEAAGHSHHPGWGGQ